MKRHFLHALTVLSALALFACAPVTPATQAVTSAPSEEFHPLSTQTGIQDIDHILEVVASGDTQTLRSLIQFSNSKCTKADGLGGPPKCHEGEAEGTPVEVLPIFGSEGHSIREEEIEKWPGLDADGLYAVYEVSADVVSDPDYPSGKYAVMFVDKENQAVISLRVDQGRIVRVDYILDNSPEVMNGWIQREASKLILAPIQ